MDPLVSAALAWYVQLAEMPGWKAQAWHSANALAQEHPQVFGDLPRLVKEEMQRRRPDADR